MCKLDKSGAVHAGRGIDGVDFEVKDGRVLNIEIDTGVKVDEWDEIYAYTREILPDGVVYESLSSDKDINGLDEMRELVDQISFLCRNGDGSDQGSEEKGKETHYGPSNVESELKIVAYIPPSKRDLSLLVTSQELCHRVI